MALSKCTKCGSGFFEMKEAEPRNASYKQIFVQCSSCGGVVGVTSYYDPGALTKELQAKVNGLEAAVQRIEHQLQQIAYRLKT